MVLGCLKALHELTKGEPKLVVAGPRGCFRSFCYLVVVRHRYLG